MNGTAYTLTHLVEAMGFSAAFAFFKCILSLLFSYIAVIFSRFKALDKVLLHTSDAVLVFTFTVSFLLLTYATRDGIFRIFDLVVIFLFYSFWMYIFRCIFKFIDNILRQIAFRVIIKPLRFLGKSLTLVLIHIIRAN